MKQTIKYKYAFDSKKNIIDISNIDRDNRNESKYYCISCEKELIAKLGDKKQHHFSHKTNTDSISCNNETYLHNLAKYKIKEIFDNDTTFNTNTTEQVICSFIKNCQLSPDVNCCSQIKDAVINLKDHYDLCTVEKQINGFKADVLLEDSSNNYKPLLIEVYVTHECSENKINSKLPIIEIYIEKEEDIQNIKEIIKSNKKTYNIHPAEVYKPLKINYSFYKYVLYNSGKYYMEKISCDDIDIIKFKTALLEISVCKNILERNSFWFYASYLGYNIRHCSICQHHKYGKSRYGSYSLCMRYKKNNTPRNPNPFYAYICEYFGINQRDYQDFIGSISKYGIKILQRHKETFNSLDLKSLYIKEFNKTLKEYICKIEDYFRQERLIIRIGENNINTSKFYNKSEYIKEKEFVHCLKLFHSEIRRPALFIYCTIADYIHPIDNSRKAICIRFDDKHNLCDFISYDNNIILNMSNQISFHNMEINEPKIKINEPSWKIKQYETISEIMSKNRYKLYTPNEISEKPQLSDDYYKKEDTILFLEREFNSKNIFIERHNHEIIPLKPLYNKCEKENIGDSILLKIFNDNEEISPIYIQTCLNHEFPKKDIPTIVLRLDASGKWKDSIHQECLLIKEGKNGEFYKADNLYNKK